MPVTLYSGSDLVLDFQNLTVAASATSAPAGEYDISITSANALAGTWADSGDTATVTAGIKAGLAAENTWAISKNAAHNDLVLTNNTAGTLGQVIRQIVCLKLFGTCSANAPLFSDTTIENYDYQTQINNLVSSIKDDIFAQVAEAEANGTQSGSSGDLFATGDSLWIRIDLNASVTLGNAADVKTTYLTGPGTVGTKFEEGVLTHAYLILKITNA